MKKYFKWSFLTALVLFLIGLLLCVIASLCGFSGVNTWKNRAFVQIKDEVKVQIKDEVKDMDDLQNIISNEEKTAVSFPADEIRELAVEFEAGEFYLQEKETEDGSIEVERIGKRPADISSDNGKLQIKMKTFRKGFFRIGKNEKYVLIVKVPKNKRFENASLSIGAGEAEINGLYAEKSMMNVGAGEICAHRLDSGEMKVKIGAGEMKVENLSCEQAEISIGMGECELEGSITGDLEAECGMGSLNMKLAGTPGDHNYSIDCAMGNVIIGEDEYSSFSSEKKNINNDAASNFKLECGMGSIEIHFAE